MSKVKPPPKPPRDQRLAAEENERIYLKDLAEIVDRSMHTIRQWELPQDLEPLRDGRDWRYWTPEQVRGIKRWMRLEKRLGRADPERVRGMLKKLREPRKQ